MRRSERRLSSSPSAASSASHREAELIQSELSDREIEVLKLIANGKDNAMIAGELSELRGRLGDLRRHADALR